LGVGNGRDFAWFKNILWGWEYELDGSFDEDRETALNGNDFWGILCSYCSKTKVNQTVVLNLVLIRKDPILLINIHHLNIAIISQCLASSLKTNATLLKATNRGL
jgi:hypothetical protein